MHSIFFLAALLTAAAAAPTPSCFGSDIQPGAGVPYGAQSDASSAKHATAIIRERHAIGWVYEDNDGSLWIGTAYPNSTTESEAAWLLRLAGARGTLKIHTGTQAPISKSVVRQLPTHGLQLVSCY